MAWVSASMPVAAVTLPGSPSTSSGSRKAMRGAASGEPIVNLNFASGSVMTRKGVTSLAVPTVVGTAKSGAGGLGGVRPDLAGRAFRGDDPRRVVKSLRHGADTQRRLGRQRRRRRNGRWLDVGERQHRRGRRRLSGL